MYKPECLHENEKHQILRDFKIWGAFNKFPYFFRIGTFIDSTHIVPFQVISSGCNEFVLPF